MTKPSSSIPDTAACTRHRVFNSGSLAMKTIAFTLGGLLLAASVAAAELQRNPDPSRVAGAPVLLGGGVIAQMTDHTPIPAGAVACSVFEQRVTHPTSWWRRFYLGEHGSPSSLRLESVMVGAESGSAPVRIRLYSIPHSTPVDTLPVDQLRQIGESAEVMVRGDLNTTTIPVTGLLADAVSNDLVVEFHTSGYIDSAFYPGGNPTPETHPSFLSAPACKVPLPVKLGDLGFPNAHLIIVANAAAPGVGITHGYVPSVIAAGSATRVEIQLANPLSTPAALSSDLSHDLPAGVTVAATPNASSTCGGTFSADAGAATVRLSGGSIPAQGHCVLAVDVTAIAGTHESTIEAGALQTSQGANTQASTARLKVIPAEGNGIVHSGPLNRALAPSWVGTSWDIARGAFSDAGRLGNQWDLSFNVASSGTSPLGMALAISSSQWAELAVDLGGNVIPLQDGDVVGSMTQFQTGANIPLDPSFMGGADAMIGMRFRCADRLPYPVINGEYCFGYFRLVTEAPAGMPARLIESHFNGNGDPITVQITPPTNPPTASALPASISLSVAANAHAESRFRLSNAIGSLPLRYATAGESESLAAVPAPYDAVPGGVTGAASFQPPLLAAVQGFRLNPVQGFDPLPWATDGGFQYLLDDGLYEASLGLRSEDGKNEAVLWLNRFAVLEAQTINSILVIFPRQMQQGGTIVGKAINLVAYYDADADGNPGNAVRLGGDHPVTVGAEDRLETYPTSFAVPGAGDVYVGFYEQWAASRPSADISTVAIDMTTHRSASYLSFNMPETRPIDLDDLSVNDITLPLGFIGYHGNFIVRATGLGQSCQGDALPWLKVHGTNDTVVGGAATDIRFSVDPADGALQPGTHRAQLCVVTNDPARHELIVPVEVTVTPALVPHPCSSAGDSLFCTGFDTDHADPIVRSGLLSVDIAQDSFGMSFDFAREEWATFPLSTDDWAPYQGSPVPELLFYWHASLAPGSNAGVAETVLGPYRVLQSGDTIGPDSTFSYVANGRHQETRAFLAGVDGYLGIRFHNEQTGQTNYGYIHVVTTWPTGFPARVVGFAYNREGGPITIP